MKGRKNQNQNKKGTEASSEGLDSLTLQKEIEKYLKVTEEIKKLEEVDPEDEKNLKLAQSLRETEIKKHIEDKQADDLLNKGLNIVRIFP